MEQEHNVQGAGVAARRRSLVFSVARSQGALAKRFSVALFDQALFAGSNFIINVLLARWMLPQDYGAFVVAYSWFLLAQNIYDAILIEPMTIYGSGKHANRFNRYLGFIFAGHVWVSLFFSAALMLGGIIAQTTGIYSVAVATAIYGTAITTPLILTRWLTRQPFYILSKPRFSLIGGIIYLVVGVSGMAIAHEITHTELISPLMLGAPQNYAGVFWLIEANLLTPFSAMLIMGVAGFVASVILTVYILKPDFRLKREEELSTLSVLKDHMVYGRWSSVDRILSWMPANVYYLILPLLFSLAESGALRAIANLMMPMHMAITALMALMLPVFVRAYHHEGRAGLNKRMRSSIAVVSVATGLFWLVTTIFGASIIHFLFDGKYDYLITLPILFTMGSIPFLTGLTVVLDAGLRAMERVKYSFLSKILPTMVTMTVGIYMTAQLGILGSNIGSIISGIISISILLYFHLSNKGATQVEIDTENALKSAEANPDRTV